MKIKVKSKVREKILIFFIIIFTIGLIVSGYKIIMWKLNVDNNKKIKDTINEYVKIDNNSESIETKYTIDFKALKENNPDTFAYLKVNNTKIDYVVVKGSNNSYYLNHNFNKEYNIAGWIFADYRNKLDGTDKNLIIYGHNTKDGSMFGTLITILDSSWQSNKDNLMIDLVTENETYSYQVFSTYSIIPEDYYIRTNFDNDNDYAEFLNKIKSRSNYNYNVEVDKDDTILTLSSCVGSGEKRVVLHAKKIELGDYLQN